MNFLKDYYLKFREELVKYGYRFDHCIDTAEDLFENSHDLICEKYPLLETDEYVKIMKRSMGNKYKDKLRREGYLDEKGKCKYPEQFSPKPFLNLDEYVCRNEELGFIREALGRMSTVEQEILINDGASLVVKSYQKYRAIKKLEKKVIEVMAEQQINHKKGCER